MTPGRYPSLSVRFTIDAAIRELAALVNTGFDGYLVVPSALVSVLPPPAFGQPVETASGQVVAVRVFPATIEFVDVPGPFDGLAIALGNEFLVGLLSINHIRVMFDHGRQLLVEP